MQLPIAINKDITKTKRTSASCSKLFIKQANVGEEYEKFTSLVNVEIKLIIQDDIALDGENESLLGKFAFSIFSSDSTYFMNKDMKITLRGMGKLEEPIKDIRFDENLEYLKDFSRLRSDSAKIDYFSIYKMEKDKKGFCLNEILRWNTDTKVKFFDRIIYVDRSHLQLVTIWGLDGIDIIGRNEPLTNVDIY